MAVENGVGPGMSSRLRRRVSIFVPAYNEAEGLEAAVTAILQAAEAELEDWQIIIVNDGSTDETQPIADRLGLLNNRVQVIHHQKNLGLGAGLASALERARLDYFVFLPGDNEVDPVTFTNIFDKVGQADVVVPYHYNTWVRPWYRRLMTFTCTALVNALLGNRLKYYQGPNVFPTALVRELPCDPSIGFFVLTEMLAHAHQRGFSVTHAHLIHRELWEGQSHALSFGNIWHALRAIFRVWWDLRIKRVAAPVQPRQGQESGSANTQT